MGGEKGRNDTAWPPGRQYARPEIFFYNPPTFYRQAAAMSGWDIRQARDTYNIAHWGGDYFDINADGHLHVRPRRDGRHPGIDLFRLCVVALVAGLALPLLVRFSDILHDRVDTLCGAFGEAMRVAGYRGRYTAVYPIKVNQQKSVVQEILRHGEERVGLEAGSKPELMAVLALSRPGGVIIGEARRLEVMPLLGVRVRLASIGHGKWQNSGGDKSKFGLSAAQALTAVETLRGAGMLDSLQLMHFHLGSQVANVRDIQRGVREAARYYAELH